MNRRNKTMLLFHIAKKDIWKQSLHNGLYGDFSIEKDGSKVTHIDISMASRLLKEYPKVKEHKSD